jgi:hypothetical protein
MRHSYISSLGISAAALVATAGLAQAQIVQDGGFESGTPSSFWTEFSTNFGTPLCDSGCLGGPPTGARTGEWWSWFGGIDTGFEQGTLTQSITIPAGTATLEFYLLAFSERTDGADYLKVFVDNVEVFSVTDQEIGPYTLDYTLVSVDISQFAGGVHTLKFDSVTNGDGFLTNLWVDDVEVISQPGGGPTCYANCDGTTAVPFLNVNDFICFQSKFAAGDTYANCDNSTSAPVLNVNDFICFQSQFAAGCSAP